MSPIRKFSLLCYEFCQGSDYVWPTMAILCKLTVQEKLFFFHRNIVDSICSDIVVFYRDKHLLLFSIEIV